MYVAGEVDEPLDVHENEDADLGQVDHEADVELSGAPVGVDVADVVPQGGDKVGLPDELGEGHQDEQQHVVAKHLK